MRKLTLIAIQLLLIAGMHAAKAQTGQSGPVNIYDASTIPENLKKDAYVVVRQDKSEFAISAPDRGTFKTHEVITVLDEKGKYHLYFQEYTDKFRLLDDVEIKVYDAKGQVIGKHKKKDLMSVADGEGLVEDGKTYYLRIVAPSYPITIETKKEMTYKGIRSLPMYIIQSPNQSVEYSGFTIKFPTDIQVNFKAYNFNAQPQKNDEAKGKQYSWEARNLVARKYEEGSGSWLNYFPHVRLNTNKFQYDGYAGDMSNWKEAGLWYNRLVKNINQLSEVHKQEIRKLVVNAKSDREKVAILYSWLQKNFRYVSIQLGIGGWRPFPADFVHEKKYGDCKGLSNYLEACLEAVNIKSYSAWIYSGETPVQLDSSFTYPYFNHQILCVPLPKDTIWLECTSPVNEFGHLGSSTENRKALLLTEKGGLVVNTPVSKPSSNRFKMNSEVKLNADGTGEVEYIWTTTGQYRYLYNAVSKEKSDDQKYFLVNQLGFPNPDEFDIRFGENASGQLSAQVKLLLDKVPDFVAGSKMFIRPRMYRFWNEKMPGTEKRMQNYFLGWPVEKSDTTIFRIPEGFAIETLPKNQSLVCEFASFNSKYWYDEQSRTIYSTAVFVLSHTNVPPDRYAETKKFMDKILDDENQKLIIKKL